MEFSSTALILLLTLVALLRNWLNSSKSFKRLNVFNFSLEYETFFLILYNVNIFWYQVCNFLLIWLWFKVENICDISILMYNLPHCLLERFHSLVVKNPNTLFTTFTCLFLGQNESSFAFGLRSPKPIHVSYFTCRIKSRATFVFF